VVVNPVAAGGRSLRRWRRLEPALVAGFPDLIVRLTERAGHGELVARAWAEEHPGGTLLACGGDGTIHEVANGWWQAGGTGRFGVIATGSGNDFARNAGLPGNPAEAVRQLSSGSVRPCDVGRVSFRAPDGTPQARIFLNSLSLGVSVRANRFAQALTPIRPSRLRYALGALGALWTPEQTSYLLRDEQGALWNDRALNLTVANGATFGGGMPISPGSSLRDGVLDLVVLRPLRGFRAVQALSRLQRGTHVALPEVSITALRGALTIATDRPDWRAEADGQELAGIGELVVQVLAGALPLLA